MLRIRFEPLWVVVPATILCVAGFVGDSGSRTSWGWMLVMAAIYLAMRIAFRLFKILHPAPVPDGAVRELLARSSKGEREEWILVHFNPRVSLDEARRRVGSSEYDPEHRVRVFFMKAQLIAPSRPDVAFFFSADKGLLIGRPPAIAELLRRHGRWTLDTWFSLLGAAQRLGLTGCSLDGPQMVVHGQHVG